MKTLKETVNESFTRYSKHVKEIGNVICEAFKFANDKEDAKTILDAIDECFIDAVVELEVDEKFDVLKELDDWAKKHKFNL